MCAAFPIPPRQYHAIKDDAICREARGDTRNCMCIRAHACLHHFTETQLSYTVCLSFDFNSHHTHGWAGPGACLGSGERDIDINSIVDGDCPR